MNSDILKLGNKWRIIKPKYSDFIKFGRIEIMKDYVKHVYTDEKKIEHEGLASAISHYRSMEIAEALGCRLPTAKEALLAYLDNNEIRSSVTAAQAQMTVDSEWTCDVRVWKNDGTPFILSKPKIKKVNGKFEYAGGKKKEIISRGSIEEYHIWPAIGFDIDKNHRWPAFNDNKSAHKMIFADWRCGHDVAPIVRRLGSSNASYSLAQYEEAILQACFVPEDSRNYIGFRLVKK